MGAQGTMFTASAPSLQEIQYAMQRAGLEAVRAKHPGLCGHMSGEEIWSIVGIATAAATRAAQEMTEAQIALREKGRLDG